MEHATPARGDIPHTDLWARTGGLPAPEPVEFRDDAISFTRADRPSLSILLVDDDEVDAKYLRWLLGSMGRFAVEVVRARSVIEARAIAAENSFDVYLVDFWLNHETSIALIGEISASRPEAAILLLTSLDSSDIEDLGLRAGAQGFLAKSDLTEKALEFGIVSALGRCKAVCELRRRVHRAEAHCEALLADIQNERLQMLESLAELRRSAEEPAKGGKRGAPAFLSDRLAALRSLVLSRLADTQVARGAIGPSVDLRDAVSRAVRIWGDGRDAEELEILPDLSGEAVPVSGDLDLLTAALVGLLEKASGLSPARLVLSCDPARACHPATIRLVAEGAGRTEAAGGVPAWLAAIAAPLRATFSCDRLEDGGLSLTLGLPRAVEDGARASNRAR